MSVRERLLLIYMHASCALQSGRRGLASVEYFCWWACRMQNWRELLRFCFARGAYRGAGADLLRSLTRGGEADTGSLFGVAAEQEGYAHCC